MRAIWKLFTGDLRRMTSNVVSIIIAIGLIVIPGLFTWFNVAASWDPFSNTKNLKFAVANVDKGYKSDLIPIKITVGDQVVNELRANSQLDWTFTSEDDAIDGTKSGKFYAAVVIPHDFSKDMMTFFSQDIHHGKLTYYTNEKLNALAPKVTGQGADQVSAQINEMFAKTITGTALSIASQLLDQLSKPEAKTQLTNFTGNIDDFAKELDQASSTLTSFGTLSDGATGLLDSSNQLISSVSDSVDKAGKDLKQGKRGVQDISGALNSTASSLTNALNQSSESFTAVGQNIDATFDSANASVNDTANSIRHQAGLIDQQAAKYQEIRDALVSPNGLQDHAGTSGEHGTIGGGTANGSVSIDSKLKLSPNHPIIKALDRVIGQLRALRDSLNGSADRLTGKDGDQRKQRQEIKDLTNQAKANIDGISSDFNKTLKPQIDQIVATLDKSAGFIDSGSAQLKSTLGELGKTSGTAKGDMDKVRDVLTSTGELLGKASGKLADFSGKLRTALNSGDMDQVRKVLGDNPETLAATLAAPVKLDRKAIFPVENFGTALTPFYTFIPLWVGSLLLAVTLKTTVSRKTRKALGDPKPHQLFFGHFGIFAVLSLLQSSFSCAGSLLFVRVHAEHPWLFMLNGWVSGLVYAFLVYTLVVSLGNIGKAIGVIFLVMQISGSGGAYPLQVLPGFIDRLNPYLPISHSVEAMRSAIAGLYMNDYWVQMGELLLFVPPMLLLGLVLRKPLVRFNQRIVAKAASTRVLE
ncbi:phage infection protein [Bifidobacterium aemilianum]|uniref:Phage infection protein n=1 Tax=Bifidobacterium aemilianum TaxID=2493120 RepID=A0A366K9B5_9BIFI|nr:YhgE/Pip domain-containing protein [Bifidobacterium aemilianum]RBP97832.1 phage infection protein [Bifidobacterium aemilianum]